MKPLQSKTCLFHLKRRWKCGKKKLNCYRMEKIFFFLALILSRKLQSEDFLVQIKGYCISDQYLTIIMEIMDGGSLYEILHERKPVPWSMLQKVRILRHIARGIESVHSKNIVHRDIK